MQVFPTAPSPTITHLIVFGQNSVMATLAPVLELGILMREHFRRRANVIRDSAGMQLLLLLSRLALHFSLPPIFFPFIIAAPPSNAKSWPTPSPSSSRLWHTSLGRKSSPSLFLSSCARNGPDKRRRMISVWMRTLRSSSHYAAVTSAPFAPGACVVDLCVSVCVSAVVRTTHYTHMTQVSGVNL